MVQTLDTNANNDIYIGPDGNLAIARGIQGVLKACETASKAQLGEMVLTQGLGIPNFQTIWIGVPNFPLWESYLVATLQSVPGVTNVQSVAISDADNTLSYSATIQTIYGTGTING